MSTTRAAAAIGAARGLALALLLAACESSPTPPASTPAPARGVDPQVRAQAHREAWTRLQPLAETALSLGDPLGAAMLDGGLPAALPYGGSTLMAARKAQEAAWREAKDLDATVLDDEPRALLRATRFALARLRDGLERRPPTRTDPSVAVEATAQGLALVRARLQHAPGDTAAIDAALAALAQSLEQGLADLGACSAATLAAAQQDLATLAAELATLPAPAPKGAAALSAAIAAARARLGEVAAALPSAKAIAWGEPARAAADPAAVARLPDRLGSAELRRRLDVEESFTTEAKAAFAQLQTPLQQFTAMLKRRPDEAGTPSAVDTARCEAAWQRLAPLLAGQAALAGAAIDGAAFVRDAGPLDDAGLMLRVVELGVVEPVERARRSGTARVLALVRGRIAPASHRHALAIAVLAGVRDEAARARAVAAARDDVGLAAAALWIHGGLGDDAAMATALGEHCSGGTWTEAALARPRAALGGLGLWLLALGPADAVALERLWWLPLGLVIDTARPPREPDAVVDTKVETLTPGQAEAGEP
ncbi:MAG: hypothetical protein K1X88_20105 [Nannocystaceae bacterium]|nr:hypothetical protein [Nannocystaceae bacterium]